jgi:hypothetical protein
MAACIRLVLPVRVLFKVKKAPVLLVDGYNCLNEHRP